MTQTAGAIATTALEHITGVNVGGIVEQTLPALAGTMIAGGLTSNTGYAVGAGLTLAVGTGLAGYAIGQLNQAQNDIDDQRETQRVNRQIWEEENGPLEDHIAAAAEQFIEDMEKADEAYGGADESGLEAEEGADVENIIGGSGKSGESGKDSSSSGDDDSPSGGGGGGGGPPGPVDDDEPASKPIAKRKPINANLPSWFALAFLDWLKNLLEFYKMLIMASFFGGILVKKFIFSPNKKKG